MTKTDEEQEERQMMKTETQTNGKLLTVAISIIAALTSAHLRQQH